MPRNRSSVLPPVSIPGYSAPLSKAMRDQLLRIGNASHMGRPSDPVSAEKQFASCTRWSILLQRFQRVCSYCAAASLLIIVLDIATGKHQSFGPIAQLLSLLGYVFSACACAVLLTAAAIVLVHARQRAAARRMPFQAPIRIRESLGSTRCVEIAADRIRFAPTHPRFISIAWRLLLFAAGASSPILAIIAAIKGATLVAAAKALAISITGLVVLAPLSMIQFAGRWELRTRDGNPSIRLESSRLFRFSNWVEFTSSDCRSVRTQKNVADMWVVTLIAASPRREGLSERVRALNVATFSGTPTHSKWAADRLRRVIRDWLKCGAHQSPPKTLAPRV